MAEEYYIRDVDADTARGPYNLDKMLTLAEAGQINRETLYYDESLESWAAIGTSEELVDKVFPEKKRLVLKRKPEAELNRLNKTDDTANTPAINVEDYLAAAEGNTEETRYLKEAARWRERAGALCLPMLTLMFFLSAIGGVYPAWPMLERMVEGEYAALMEIWRYPTLALTLLDLFLVIGLGLSVTQLFGLVRLRLMFGLGLLGLMHWALHLNGNPAALTQLALVAAFSLGAYICTLTLNFKLMVLAVITGLAGVVGHLYFGTIVNLL